MLLGFICGWGVQVGPRSAKDRERFPPNNVLLMLAGAGLLWMGWSGFNGGGPYAANVVSSMAILNTNICAATSLLVWTCLDVIFFKKPSVIGAVQGMITGLVCITPGAGKGDSILIFSFLYSFTNRTVDFRNWFCTFCYGFGSCLVTPL